MSRFFHPARRGFLLGASLAAAIVATGCARRAVDAPPVSVVFFDTNSGDLDSAARGVIREFATDAKANPTRPIVVRGYADPDATRQTARTLSALRVQMVSQALVSEGVAQNRISQRPRGPSNLDPGIESRRVEIELVR